LISIKCPPAPFVGAALELRRSKRYRVQAMANFWWERSDGLLQEGKGRSRDISDRGIFITGEITPALGAHLDVDVYLPSLDLFGAAVHLHGEGTVVRIARKPDTTPGFAAAVTFQTETASGRTVMNPKRVQ
jgi:hypothetical protein